MNKFKISIVCTILLLCIAVLLYVVPWPAPIDFTVNVVKLDSKGNEIGVTQVHIEGHKLQYLFQEERIVLTIDPFDDLYQIEDSKVNGELGHVSYIGKHLDYPEFMQLHYNAKSKDATGDVMCVLTISMDMQCFALHCFPFGSDYEETAYVGSVSGDYSAGELIEFFNGLVPGK